LLVVSEQNKHEGRDPHMINSLECNAAAGCWEEASRRRKPLSILRRGGSSNSVRHAVSAWRMHLAFTASLTPMVRPSSCSLTTLAVAVLHCVLLCPSSRTGRIFRLKCRELILEFF